MRPRADRWAHYNTRTRGEKIQLGLKRILQLFPPSKINFNSIHVAGTNGKGTVCFYTEHILRSRGLSVARFTSPHLVDRWDCININGRPVREGIFKSVEAVYRNKNEVEKIGASPFEILTATAFDLFNMHKVDVAVVEVGVGGSDDATNILPQEKVLCSVITQIGLDHQGLLGDTLSEIAEHKAGIIRRGVPCVYDPASGPAVNRVIEDKIVNPHPTPICWVPRHTKGVFSLAPVTNRHAGIGSVDYGGNLFPASSEKASRQRILSSGWVGPFGDGYLPDDFAKPVVMAATAARLSLQRTRGPTVGTGSLLACLKGRQWPGRLQSLSLEPLLGRRNPVLIDGAHNVDSADRLARFVTHRFRVNPERETERGTSREAVTWVLAASAGKDTAGMLRTMLRAGDTLVTTKFGPVDGMPWVSPTDAQQLLYEARTIQRELNPASCVAVSVRDALEQATKIAQEGPLIIAGSLYLVSDVLRLVRGTGGDPGTWWDKWETPVKLDRSLWTPVPGEEGKLFEQKRDAGVELGELEEEAPVDCADSSIRQYW